MQFLDGGAGGPNGRDSRGRPTDSGATRPSPDDSPEAADGAQGSLMQRYRGTGAPPPDVDPARSAEVNPPLPPPQPAGGPAGVPGPAAETARGWGDTGAAAWGPAAPAPAPAHTPAVPVAPGTAGHAGAPSGTGTGAGTGTGGAATSAGRGTSSTGTSSTRTGATGTDARDGGATRDSAARDSAARDSAARDSAARDSAARDSAAGRPGTGSAAPATLSGEQAADFKRRWREVQGDFVDDPRQAVRSADELAREVLDALAAKIADRQRVDSWQDGDGSGTEDLRRALRQYRKLVDRLLEL